MIKRYGLVYRGSVFKDQVQGFLIKQMEIILGRHLQIFKLQKTMFTNVLTSLVMENSKENMVSHLEILLCESNKCDVDLDAVLVDRGETIG